MQKLVERLQTNLRFAPNLGIAERYQSMRRSSVMLLGLVCLSLKPGSSKFFPSP